MSRSVMGYAARKRRDETILVKKIHELAVRRSRYGYRRITVLLRREGFRVNHKRVHRIWGRQKD
jgi:putative transposase